MHFYQNLYIGTNGVVHGLNKLNHFILLGSVKFVEAFAEGIELEGLIALFKHTFGGCMELLGCPFDSVPAVGIGLDSIPHSATQQLIDWLPKSFAHNVPACDLYRRNSGHSDFTHT